MRLISRSRRLLPLLGDGFLLTLPMLPYIVAILLVAHDSKEGAFDLHVFWEAARAFGHGNSPYDAGGLAHARHLVEIGSSSHPPADWAVYPPAVFALLVPFGLLPWPVAAVVGTAALAIAPALALRVMGVRDWRCYFVAYGSAPITTSILLGTMTPALMLGFALVWRGRSVILAGTVTIVAKLFLWPLGLVVAAIYRCGQSAIIAAVAIVSTLGAWSIIGFADLTRFPAMLSDLSAIEAHDSSSTTGVAHALGLTPAIGTYAGLALGLAVAGGAFRAASHGRRDAAFTLALIAALLSSPILWTHYLALLFLPLAARYPRFNRYWLVPVVCWLGTPLAAKGDPLTLLAFWSCVAIVGMATLRPDDRTQLHASSFDARTRSRRQTGSTSTTSSSSAGL